MSRKPPEMVHLAIARPDTPLAIMGFVTTEFAPNGDVRWSRLATYENVCEELVKAQLATHQDLQDGTVAWRFVTSEDVPSDRTYRDAWRDDGEKIFHDMDHARRLHRDLLRAARAPKLAELDVAYIRALESGVPGIIQPIVAEKVKLRDVTKDARIEAAQTIDALKAISLEG